MIHALFMENNTEINFAHVSRHLFNSTFCHTYTCSTFTHICTKCIPAFRCTMKKSTNHRISSTVTSSVATPSNVWLVCNETAVSILSLICLESASLPLSIFGSALSCMHIQTSAHTLFDTMHQWTHILKSGKYLVHFFGHDKFYSKRNEGLILFLVFSF